MRDLSPIYRLFPADQLNRVNRPGIMIAASTDVGAASIAKNILHSIGSGGELWADNQIIRQFRSPLQDEVMEHVWSTSTRAWRSVDMVN